VIPETTAKDTERLADLRITHALGVDFHILGDENLAPACHACNSDKLAHLLSPERAALISDASETSFAQIQSPQGEI
jgi:hypothetical protein